MFFFLKPHLILITLIKTKCVVIYHGENNGGNNGYYRQRLRQRIVN